MAEDIGIFLTLWLMHAVVAMSLAAPIVFVGRRRAQWQPWELLAFVLPFSIWMGLMFSDLESKSMSNMSESVILASTLPIAAFIRIWFGGMRNQRFCACVLIAILCGAAVGVYFLTPALPE